MKGVKVVEVCSEEGWGGGSTVCSDGVRWRCGVRGLAWLRCPERGLAWWKHDMKGVSVVKE